MQVAPFGLKSVWNNSEWKNDFSSYPYLGSVLPLAMFVTGAMLVGNIRKSVPTGYILSPYFSYHLFVKHIDNIIVHTMQYLATNRPAEVFNKRLGWRSWVFSETILSAIILNTDYLNQLMARKWNFLQPMSWTRDPGRWRCCVFSETFWRHPTQLFRLKQSGKQIILFQNKTPVTSAMSQYSDQHE